MYTFTGKVTDVGNIQTFASGFTKRELILEEEKEKPSKYPNPVKFTFKKDDCALLDGIKKGQVVRVGFHIDGRRWDGPKGVQYFTDLNAFKIEVDGVNEVSTPQPATPPEGDFQGGAEDDDIPF